VFILIHTSPYLRIEALSEKEWNQRTNIAQLIDAATLSTILSTFSMGSGFLA